MKKILITQSIYTDLTRNEFGDKVDSRIIRFVQAAKYLPVALSNHLITNSNDEWDTSGLDAFLNRVNIGGIVLTGGPDFGVHEH